MFFYLLALCGVLSILILMNPRYPSVCGIFVFIMPLLYLGIAYIGILKLGSRLLISEVMIQNDNILFKKNSGKVRNIRNENILYLEPFKDKSLKKIILDPTENTFCIYFQHKQSQRPRGFFINKKIALLIQEKLNIEIKPLLK
jgi:hypothetical protein